MLYSMAEHTLVNLAHLVAEPIIHQGQHPWLGHILVRPYITCLVRGMNTLNHICSMERVRGVTLLGLQTLFSIGMIIHRGEDYVLVNLLDSDDEEDEPGDKCHTPVDTVRFKEEFGDGRATSRATCDLRDTAVIGKVHSIASSRTAGHGLEPIGHHWATPKSPFS